MAARDMPVAQGQTRPGLSMRAREEISGWLWASPWILGFLFFTLGPMIASHVQSFFNWSELGTPRFAGFENYIQALSGRDPLYWRAWERTWLYALLFILLAWSLWRERSSLSSAPRSPPGAERT